MGASATRSSPSCTKLLAVHQEVCQVACLEVCLGVCQVQVEHPEPDLDPLLKKSIKIFHGDIENNLLIYVIFVNKHYSEAFKKKNKSFLKNLFLSDLIRHPNITIFFFVP